MDTRRNTVGIEYTEEIVREIANKSLANSNSLIADAELLYVNKRFARAYTLFQLAMEESGKSVASMILLVEGITDKGVKKFKNTVMQKHQIKAKNAALMDLYICELISKGDISEAIKFWEERLKEDYDDLNIAKNYSLYTSENNQQIKNPNEWVTLEKVTKIRFISISRCLAANAWVKTGLDNLPELKEYLIENPVKIPSTAEERWNFLTGS